MDPGPHRVTFELTPDEDGYPHVGSERLWAEKLDDGNYQIDNIPFYVRGISAGDVVQAGVNASGELVFQRLVEARGNSTFRIYVKERDKLALVRKEVLELGMVSEANLQAGLVAVEIPASVDIRPFLEYILRGKDGGRFDFEEAALRHEV